MREVKPSMLAMRPGITNQGSRGVSKKLSPGSNKSEQTCLVQGSLAVTLFVCRFFGIAPLSFSRCRGGWFVSVSPALCVYTHLLNAVLVTGILVGVAMDYYAENERSVRMRTPTASVAWISELSAVMAAVIVGGYDAPRRMVAMIAYLNILMKVDSKFPKRPSDKKGMIFASAWIVGASLIYYSDFYSYLNDATAENRDLTVMYLYSCCYAQYVIAVVMPMQFVFTGFMIQSNIKLINDALRDIIHAMDENNEAPESSKVAMSVRRLALYFGTVCEVINAVDASNSFMLLMLLGALFLHLVVTPYYLVTYILSSKVNTITSLRHLIFCCLHLFSMVILVEPGHRTEQEIEQTKKLVSQLLRRVSSPWDALAVELDYFCQLIALNRVCYSAQGVCTLARPLIAMIFGAVTTYLVIILQFQSLDKNIL